MKKIPLIATQTYNSTTNLKALLRSIDYPVETVSVVVNNENFEILKEIKLFCDSITELNENIDKIDVSWHPTNLGCPASWNYHFKCYPHVNFVIKADDDIKFTSGDLQRMVEHLEYYELVFTARYACFAIKVDTFFKIGLFDENFYPCNYEDDDYEIRAHLFDVKQIELNRISEHIMSGTSRNLEDHEKEHGLMSKYLEKTEEYFFRKWGNRLRTGQFYKTPFNSGISPNTTYYDLEYRKDKIFRCNYAK